MHPEPMRNGLGQPHGSTRSGCFYHTEATRREERCVILFYFICCLCRSPNRTGHVDMAILLPMLAVLIRVNIYIYIYIYIYFIQMQIVGAKPC